MALTACLFAHQRWMGLLVGGRFRMNSSSAAALLFRPSPIRSRAARNWNGALYLVRNCTTSGSRMLEILRESQSERQRLRLPHSSYSTETCRREVTRRGSVESPMTVPSGYGRRSEISRQDDQQLFTRCHRRCRRAIRRHSTGFQFRELFDIRSGSMIQPLESLRLSHPFARSRAI